MTAGTLVIPQARLILPAGAPEDEWHAARALGVGGSDVAAILGMHKHRGPLHVWQEKHGRDSGGLDTGPGSFAYFGHKLEPVIAEIFAEMTGMTLVPSPGMLQHAGDDCGWMLANVDAFVAPAVAPPRLGQLPQPVEVAGPLECKNRSAPQAADWSGEGEAPDDAALQAVWYMAVTGYADSWIAGIVGGNRLVTYHLQRDDELIEHLVDFIGSWMARYVWGDDVPQPDGLSATTDLLAHLWEARPEAVREVPAVEAFVLLEQRAALRREAEALAAKADTVDNRLRALLGEDEIATVGGQPVYSWIANGNFRGRDFREQEPEMAARYTTLRPTIDKERLAAEEPELYRRYRARALRVPKGVQTSD